MNICVIDDCKFTIESIEKMIIESSKELNITQPNVYSFTEPHSFISWLSKNNSVDACFLDIKLENEIDGLKIAKLIKDKNYHTLIVFMTGYDGYFPEMVQVEPFRFLPKPIEYDKFYTIFNDIYNRIVLKKSEERIPKYMYKSNGITYAIDLDEIIYFSSYKRKIHIHRKIHSDIDFYGKLDEVEEEIRSMTNKFIRINKSYLFNADYIDYIGKNTISVEGIEYTISPKYRDNIKIIT